MFPVPSHLPRTGGDAIASDPSSRPPAPPDPVLDLLDPVLSAQDGPSALSTEQIRKVREALQQAVASNKDKAHEVLLSNFPSVSSHIRLGAEARGDYRRVLQGVEKLEREIDPNDASTSFLPPTLDILNRHFSAAQNRARAQQHVAALIFLQVEVDRLAKLESAVWAGRGADEWVLSDLLDGPPRQPRTDGALHGSRIARAAEARMKLLRGMVVEQVSDGFHKAVSFSEESGVGLVVTVQAKTSLQQPRIPRPNMLNSSSPSKPALPPPYSIPHIYLTLHRLGALAPLLQSLQTRVVRDILQQVLSGLAVPSVSSADNRSSLHLQTSSSKPSPSSILDSLTAVLSFISTSIFPPCTDAALSATRQTFLSALSSQTLRSILSTVLLPSLPSPLASVPQWLKIVHQAVSFESSVLALSADSGVEEVVRPFLEGQAGEEWAKQRQRRVAEEVRRLVVGGWGGWEAIEVEREREVVVVVEIEEYESEPEHMDEDRRKGEGENGIDEGFGWGFDDETATTGAGRPKETEAAMDVDQGDGWGFEAPNPEAGPSKPRPATPPPPPEEPGEGWDFDMDATPIKPAEPIAPAPIKKPAREAKRLGKKVAKVKAKVAEEDEYDPWGSGTESSVQESVALPASTEEADVRNGLDGRQAGADGDEWGWEDDTETKPGFAPAKEVQKTKQKRKVLKEEKRKMVEKLLVSRACDKLLDMAERVLHDAQELERHPLPSPSFASAPPILLAATSDIFDLHRSLLPTLFASQIRDVPAIAFQFHNDCLHLAERVRHLASSRSSWAEAGEGVQQRLEAMGEWAYERQLEVQRDGVWEMLADVQGLEGMGDEGMYRKGQRAVGEVKRAVESLGKVLKPVLPNTTRLAVLGYVLDVAAERISSDILALEDITERESERLNELVRMLIPLEEMFVLEEGQPSTVVKYAPHWLKFCYMSELLQANLVDITYLHEHGALVDFTTDELVRLVRALFAASEKRDKAIEGIERGPVGIEGVGSGGGGGGNSEV